MVEGRTLQLTPVRISAELCGAQPVLGAKSAWLVAVEHLTPDAEHDEHWSATSADSDGERYVPMLRMQHDGVFIWALSENGDFDLAH